jgi:hypothetical protein
MFNLFKKFVTKKDLLKCNITLIAKLNTLEEKQKANEARIKALVKCLEVLQEDQSRVVNLVELLAIKKDILEKDYH